jgi:hypothetical protein
MDEDQQRVYSQVVAVVDACIPECRPRREFIINWRAKGIDEAYRIWKDSFRIINPEHIPTLETLIIEVKRFNVKPH